MVPNQENMVDVVGHPIQAAKVSGEWPNLSVVWPYLPSDQIWTGLVQLNCARKPKRWKVFFYVGNTFFDSRVKFEWETPISVCLATIGLRRERLPGDFYFGKKIEQRVCLKFCVFNGITATESLKMLQKYFGESTLLRTQVFEWHKAFSEGRGVVENLPHASRPSTSVNDDNIEKMKKIVLENRRVGIREVEEALNISYGSTQHIVVHVLGMKRVAARLVPKDITLPMTFSCFQNSNIRSGQRAMSRMWP